MKIIIFGTGQIYNRWKDEIKNLTSEIEIIAFFDNSVKEKEIDGIPVMTPADGINLAAERIVITSSKYLKEMKVQLLELGWPEDKIVAWNKFKAEIFRNQVTQDQIETIRDDKTKNVLIVTTSLDYNGGSLAVLYAAEALTMRGHCVSIASDWANENLLAEVEGKGFHFIWDKSLPYIFEEDFTWIQKFDAVIVNVFQMMAAACEIGKRMPTLWWIHEPTFLYQQTINEFEEYSEGKDFRRIDILGVSSVAQNNFNKFYPNVVKETLLYGIPDKRKQLPFKDVSDKVVYAVVGSVCSLKSQHIFIESALKLTGGKYNDCEFWVIGSIGNDKYSTKIKEYAKRDERIKIMGQMTREEIEKAYEKIDIVVCASSEETVSIVATEGMMLEKVCIVSDCCGIKDLISDGKDGFVFRYGEIDELAEIMAWCKENPEACEEIGRQARKVYEEHFTLESLGERLEIKLVEPANKYKEGS